MELARDGKIISSIITHLQERKFASKSVKVCSKFCQKLHKSYIFAKAI